MRKSVWGYSQPTNALFSWPYIYGASSGKAPPKVPEHHNLQWRKDFFDEDRLRRYFNNYVIKSNQVNYSEENPFNLPCIVCHSMADEDFWDWVQLDFPFHRNCGHKICKEIG